MTGYSVVVRVPSSTYRDFKFVLAKYGQDFRNVCYMVEINKAILRYMKSEKAVIVEESRQSTHAQTQNPTNESQIQNKQYPAKFVQFLSRVIQYLNDCDQHYDVKYYVHVRVSKENLRKAIAHECSGIDRRMITKYQGNLTKSPLQ